MRVQINMIKVKPGRRVPSPEDIEELSKSISEVGLVSSITVDRDYTLIAGLSRMEAAKLLGWTEIECTVSDLEGLQAELAELDENFVRSKLSTVEYGELLLRRKEIYEALHPETKNGAAQGEGMKRVVGGGLSDKMSLRSKPFTADTSEKLGVSKRTIERQIKIAKDLTPEAAELVRHSDISQQDALKLSRLEPKQQMEAAKLLAAGDIAAFDEYLSAHAGNPTSETQPFKEQPPSDKETHTANCASGVPDSLADRKMPGEISAEQAKTAESREGKPPSTDGRVGSPLTVTQPEPPFSLGGKRFETFQDSVADLKDPEKDCSCTPDSLLAEITEFVKKFYQEIEWFHHPYYEGVFPILSQTQYDYFCRQMDALHTAVEHLSNYAKKGRINTHE